MSRIPARLAKPMPIEAPALSPPELGPSLALALISLSLAVGLASYLLVLQGLWIGTRNEDFRSLRRDWSRVLAWEVPAAGICLAWLAATGPLWATLGAAGADFPYRPLRLALAAILATALLVGAASGARLWRKPDDPAACRAIRMTIGMLVICAPLELAFADGALVQAPLATALQAAVLALGLWGGILCWRGAPERSPSFLGGCMAGGVLGLAIPLAVWESA